MIGAWTTFGKTGSPGSFIGREWPQFPKQMVLAPEPQVPSKPWPEHLSCALQVLESDLSPESDTYKVRGPVVVEQHVCSRESSWPTLCVLPKMWCRYLSKQWPRWGSSRGKARTMSPRGDRVMMQGASVAE